MSLDHMLPLRVPAANILTRASFNKTSAKQGSMFPERDYLVGSSSLSPHPKLYYFSLSKFKGSVVVPINTKQQLIKFKRSKMKHEKKKERFLFLVLRVFMMTKKIQKI